MGLGRATVVGDPEQTQAYSVQVADRMRKALQKSFDTNLSTSLFRFYNKKISIHSVSTSLLTASSF